MPVLSQAIPAAHTSAQKLSFEQAWEAHRGRVFHWALRYGAGDAAWAEDVSVPQQAA